MNPINNIRFTFAAVLAALSLATHLQAGGVAQPAGIMACLS